MDRSYQEYFNMFTVLGECRKNYRQAANTYTERYLNHEKKSHVSFKRLSERFIAYGTVKEEKRTRRKTATNENAIKHTFKPPKIAHKIHVM